MFVPCVQTNTTQIDKALQIVLTLNPTLAVSPQQAKLIAKMANLDMSVALNLLRMLPRTRKGELRAALIEKDLADTNLFHRFGKIMYNKSSFSI